MSNANSTTDSVVNQDGIDVAIFASQKCPPGAGLDSACQLPFGFLCTPLIERGNNDEKNVSARLVGTSTSTGKIGAVTCRSLPEMCLTCLSYRSKYSHCSVHSGNWTCKICGQDQNELVSFENINDNDFLRLESTMHECRQPVCNSLKTGEDHTSRLEHPVVDTQSIALVLDQNLLALEAHCIIQTFREVVQEIFLEYKSSYTATLLLNVSLLVFGKNVSLFQLGVCTSTTASADVVRTHEGLVLPSNNDRVQQRAYFITLSYGNTSSTLESQLEPLLTCITAHYGVAPTLLDVPLDPTISLTNGNGLRDFDPTMSYLCNKPDDPAIDERMVNSSSSTNSGRKTRMQMLKERKEARQQQDQPTNNFENSGNSVRSPWIAGREQRKHHFQSSCSSRVLCNSGGGPQYRCTGEAIECAMELVSATPHEATRTISSTSSGSMPSMVRTGRILLFTNGCPNYGNGSCVDATNKFDIISYNTVDLHNMVHASEFFEGIAKSASECGIGIDVFCSGTSDLAIPAFQSLAEPSAGYVLSVDSFWSNKYQFQHNLRQILLHTYISLAKYGTQDSNLNEERSSSSRKSYKNDDCKDAAIDGETHSGVEWIDGVLIDIRMSSFVTPTHLIGPGDLVDSIASGPLPNERAWYESVSTLVNNHQLSQSARTNSGASSRSDPESAIVDDEASCKRSKNLHPVKASTATKRRKKKITININQFMLESSLTRIRLGRYDPKATFSVMMRLNEFYDYRHDQFAFFQITVRYVNRIGTELVTQISSYRLPISKDSTDYFESLHPKVVPVLLGKEAVYRAMYGGDSPGAAGLPNGLDTDVGFADKLAYEAQRDLDETIFRISRSYRLLRLEKGSTCFDCSDEEKGIEMPSSKSSIDTAFPPGLSDALRSLYHMRRGPFLSPGPFQSTDDKAELRSLFLRLPLDDCFAMMAPKLWSCSAPSNSSCNTTTGVPYMEDVPPETLVLWNNRVIAADHFHSLFVWSGKEVATPEFDGLRNYLKHFLLERSAKRFPMPNFHLLNENDSMSRRFTSLLAPSHGDPIEHQLAHFPALALQLSEKERTKLRLKFQFYDPESDPSFRNWFWDITSAIGDRDVGESLCE